MRRFPGVFVLALGLMLVAGPAAADGPKKIQILTIMSDDAFQQAQALTVALKRAADHADGWALAKGDFSLEVLVAALNCPAPPDAACQKKIGSKVGTDRYIWGTLHLDKGSVVADLHLWEGSEQRHTTLKYSANLTDASDDALQKIADNGFAALAGAAQGALVVEAGSVSGDVLLDGNPIGQLKDGRGEFLVPVGTHEVRVRADGYHDAVSTVSVSASGRADVTLNPSKITAGNPGGGDNGVTLDTGKTSTRRILAYTGIGVGAALIGGGIYSWVKINSINNDSQFDQYRRALPRGKDVCDEAQANHTYEGGGSPSEVASLCSSAKTWETLQYVFFGAGAVAAGVGTYLLLTDKPAEQAKAEPPRFMPMVGVGPRGGSVDVRLAF